MNRILQALNRPVEAFKEKNKWVAWGLVLLTILINAVFEPFLRKYTNSLQHEINIARMLATITLGSCTYIVICIVFWLVAKCFGSQNSFKDYLYTWGLTYFPTILCSFVVAFTEVYFYVFWNSIIWGMVFNILFVAILLWKSVLYLLYLREVAGLSHGKWIGAGLVIGIFIIMLAMGNGYVGVKTPVL